MNLTVEHGAFSYKKGGREILHDVNFSLGSGEILAILGPNGAGKTTLLRCVMGFLKWTGGRSLLDGEDIAAMPPRALWRKLAYVPQARGRASGALVENMVLLGRSNRIGALSQPGAKDYAAVDAVLERLFIAHLRGKRCDEISGGELQMALIARALVAEPVCVIFDEPESNLDFRNQLIVLETMERLRDEGVACLFNTHYPDHALRCADKALLLSKTGAPVYGGAFQVITEQAIGAAFGVESVIARVQTPGHDYPFITPVAVRAGESAPIQPAPEGNRLATVSIIVGDEGDVERVNRALHDCGGSIIGRCGLPYPDRHVRVITVVLDAPQSEIERLAMRINHLHGVSIKTTYA